MQFAVGSYVGNGLDDRPITGIGFQPDLVIIKANSFSQLAVWRSSLMVGDASAVFVGSLALQTNCIQSLDADGFTVGTSTRVNGGTQTYHWMAFKDNGVADFKVGSYTGNAADDRNITGLGFDPNLACVKGNTTSGCFWRTSSNSGDQAMPFGLAGDTTNCIQGFVTDGFQVGTSLNANTIVYYYFAFKNVTGFIAQGVYTGNGVDNRSISGLGFQPNMVWIKAAQIIRGMLRPSSLAGDATLQFDSQGQLADAIQALEADGFQVGTLNTVNFDTYTYRWAAWKVGTTGLTPQSGTDSGVSTETGSMAEAFSDAESGASTETSALEASLPATESGIATETSGLEATLADNDSGLASESAVMAEAMVGTESGEATESSTVAVIKEGTEEGTAAESSSLEATLSATEDGAGAENSEPTGARIATISYVGTGAAQTISTVGFQGNLVIIKGGSDFSVFRTSDMPDDWCIELANNAGGFADGIRRFTANGFELGADSRVNAVGVTYHAQVFKDNGTPDFTTGVYTGDGIDGKAITTGMVVNPTLIGVKRDGVDRGTWRPGSMSGDLSISFNQGWQGGADRIQSLTSTGFTVGGHSEVNAVGGTYYWFAFGEIPDWIKTGSYVGNGIAGHAIAGVGFAPDSVWSGGGPYALYHPDTTAGTLFFSNVGEYGDLITSLDSDGFTLGYWYANTNGVLYHYFAFKEGQVIFPSPAAFLSGSDDGVATESGEVIWLFADTDSGLATESSSLLASLSGDDSGLAEESSSLLAMILAVESGLAAESAVAILVLGKHIIRATIESTLEALADSLSLELVESSPGSGEAFAQSWRTLTQNDLIRVRLGLVGVGFDDYGIFRVDAPSLTSSANSWRQAIQARDKASLLIEERGRASGGFSYGDYPDENQEEFTRPTCKAIGKRIAEEVGLGLIWQAPNYQLKSFAIGRDERMSSVLSRLLAPLQHSQRYRTDAWVDGDNLVVRQRNTSPILGTIDCNLGMVTGISRRREPPSGAIDVYGGTEVYHDIFSWNEQRQDTRDEKKDEPTSSVEVEDDGLGHRVVKTFLQDADGNWVQIQEEIEDQDYDEVYDGDKWIGRVLLQTRTLIKTNMNTTEKQEKRTVTLGYDDAYRLTSRHELTEEYKVGTGFEKKGQTHTRYEQVTPTDLQTTVTEWRVSGSNLKVSKGFPRRTIAPGQLQASIRVVQDAKSAWDEKENDVEQETSTKTKTTERTVQYHGSANGGGTLPKAFTDSNLMSNSACQDIADDLAAESGKWVYGINLDWPRPFAYRKGDRVTLTHLPGDLADQVAIIVSLRTAYDRTASVWVHDVSFEFWADL